VQQDQRTAHDEQVADAQHVPDRPRAWDRDDVAQEQQPRVLDRSGVRKPPAKYRAGARPASDEDSVVKVLLRETRGFESSFPACMRGNAYRKAIAKCQDVRCFAMDCQPITADSLKRPESHDLIASLAEMAYGDPERLPRAAEVLPVLPHPLMAFVNGLEAWKETRSPKLDVFIQSREHRFEVPSAPCLIAGAREFKVLLRHRPSSIPSGNGGRNALEAVAFKAPTRGYGTGAVPHLKLVGGAGLEPATSCL
jgi:hypothetical protein